MRKHIYYISSFCLVFGLVLSTSSCQNTTNTTHTETTKLALRDVGHHLLLSNQDSTSLVKPVLALGNNTYQLAFENTLSIHPDSLVDFIKTSFSKVNLPSFYLTEVLQCQDNEVAYSYEIKQNIEKGIVPCGGRQLHKGCYLVTVRFTKMKASEIGYISYFILSLIGVIAIVFYLLLKRKSKPASQIVQNNYQSIGSYKFYPNQNKLIKEATTISLSKKECELLELFIVQPNQVIKRDELTKKVWEDKGVIVGRSLDTYISKLRKKLQEDPNVKLTNVHGIGYKLEL